MSRAGDAGFPTFAVILIGAGLAGFFDGIVLRELLQWHYALTGILWLCIAAGFVLLWRRAHRTHSRWSTRALLGALLIGFGAFNLVEGVVHEPPFGAWNLAFLACGALMVIAGWRLKRGSRAVKAKLPAEERRRRPMRWRPGDRRRLETST